MTRVEDFEMESSVPAASRQHPDEQLLADATPEPAMTRVEDIEMESYVPDSMEDVQSTCLAVSHTIPSAFQSQGPPNIEEGITVLPSNEPAQESALPSMAWAPQGPRRKIKRCAVCQQTDCPGRGKRSLCKVCI